MSFIRSVAAKRGLRLPPKSTTYVADLSAHPCAELNALINQSILSLLPQLMAWNPGSVEAYRDTARNLHPRDGLTNVLGIEYQAL